MNIGVSQYKVTLAAGVNQIVPGASASVSRVRIVITLVTGSNTQLGHDPNVMTEANSGLFLSGVGMRIIDEATLFQNCHQGAWYAYGALNDVIGIYEEFIS